LHSLSPQPPTRNGLLPPLSRGPVPESANSPDHVQVDAGAKNSKQHHGKAYCILVKAGCWSLCSRGNYGESSKPDDQPNAAERHGECADALQDDEKKTRYSDSPSADASAARKLMCLRSLRGDHCSLSSHTDLTLNSRRGYRRNSGTQNEGQTCNHPSIPRRIDRTSYEKNCLPSIHNSSLEHPHERATDASCCQPDGGRPNQSSGYAKVPERGVGMQTLPATPRAGKKLSVRDSFHFHSNVDSSEFERVPIGHGVNN